MPPYQLDSTDAAIIDRLRADGRASHAAIASAVGLSDDAVRARITRMTNDSILKITGVVDPRMLGYHSQAAVVGAFRGDLKKVAQALQAYPEVTFLAVIVGEWNVLCEVTVKDDNALADFVADHVWTIDGVHAVDVWKHLTVHKWQTGVAHHGPPPPAAGVDEPPQLDELDIKLLTLLSANPRASFTELQAEVGTTYNVVRRRSQRLFGQGIIRAETVVNRVSTQTMSMATLGMHVDTGIGAVLDEIAAISQVEILIRTSGRYPVIAEIGCTSEAELVAVTDAVHNVVGVSAVDIFPHSRIEKLPAEWAFVSLGAT